MTEVKPCPFCGRVPTVDDCGENRFFVRCKCGIAQDKLYGQRCDAVRRWNTRRKQPERKGETMDEMTITLNSPITDEQWDAITDVDFDDTDRIWFHTKHGKDVEFVKRKKGRWIGYNTDKEGWNRTDGSPVFMSCSECGGTVLNNGSAYWNFCPNCGAKMEGEKDEQ